MTGVPTLSGARAAAARAQVRFGRVLAAVLGLQALAGLVALVAPLGAASWIGSAPPVDAAGWVRAWAGMMLVAALFQLPGLVDAIGARSAIVAAIVARFALALLYLLLGGGFVWLAVFEGMAAVATLLAFQALIRAEIMTRP